MTAAEITTFSAALVLGGLQAWNTYQQKKTSKTVNEVHVLVNSNMGLTLHALAQVTAAKAAITKNDMDIDDANDAMAKYLDHVEKQAKVDAEK